MTNGHNFPIILGRGGATAGAQVDITSDVLQALSPGWTTLGNQAVEKRGKRTARLDKTMT